MMDAYKLLVLVTCLTSTLSGAHVSGTFDFNANKNVLHVPNTKLNSASDNETETDKMSNNLFTIDDVVRSLIQNGIDYAYLLKEYNKICPGVPRKCSVCLCESDCAVLQRCCPDCPYAFLKTGCYDLAIFGQDTRGLINKCPITFEGAAEIKELCASNDTELVPVSSGNLDFTNRFCAECHGVDIDATWDLVVNCEHPLPDKFKIDDNLNQNLKYSGCVVTFQHPMAVYAIYGRNVVLCHRDDSMLVIKKCNVTGLWEEADPNIVWGCENLDTLPKFDMLFKNVFCYLCNPSIASTTTRDEIQPCEVCVNETISGRLLPYGNRCLMQCNGVDDNTYVDKLRANASDTLDVDVFEHVDTTTGKSDVRISLVVYTYNDIFSIIHPMLLDLYDRYIFLNKENEHYLGQNANSFSQKQIWTYEAICGDNLICDKSLLSEGTLSEMSVQNKNIHSERNESHLLGREYESVNVESINHEFDNASNRLPISIGNSVCETRCSCDPTCVITNTCCVDILVMEQPFGCYRENDFPTFSPNGNDNNLFNANQHGKKTVLSYSMINTCLGNSPTDLKIMCSGTANKTNVLHYIPVISNSLVFKNVYCLLCYLKRPEDIQIDINLECDSYIEANHFPDVYSMLKAGRDRCRTTFKPIWRNSCRKPYKEDMSVSGTFYIPGNEPFTPDNVTFIYKCNETGQWFKDDYNIRRLCEEDTESILRLPEYRISSIVYKNFACLECNPDFPLTVIENVEVIENCTDPTRMFHETLQSLCIQRPYHRRWLPYKNLFCAMCNSPPLFARYVPPSRQTSEIKTTKPIEIGYRTQTYTYRDIFSLKGASKGSVSSDASTCSGIFDSKQNVCHEFECGQGRVLVNGTCRHDKTETRHDKPETLARPTDDDSASESDSHGRTIGDTQRGGPYVPQLAAYNPHTVTSGLSVNVAGVSQKFVTSTDFAHTVYYKLRLRIRQTMQAEMFELVKVMLEEMCLSLLSDLWVSFEGSTNVSFKCTIYNISCNNQTYITLQPKSVLVVSYDIKAPDKYVPGFENTLVSLLNGESTFTTVYGNNLSFVSSPVSTHYSIGTNTSTCRYKHNWQGFGSSDIVLYVDKFLTCPYIVLNETEVDFDNESQAINLHRHSATYSKEDYERVRDSFRICKDDYNNGNMSNNHAESINVYDRVYHVFNNICVVASLICLIFTFATFSIFKTLRTVPGKNIMTLTLSLFLSQLLILIGPFMTTSDTGCAIIAVLIHFWWLSMFCAMCACSFHMFRIFYINSMSPPSQGTGANYTVAKYNMFVFGFPLVIVSVVILYHILTTNGDYLGYGNRQICFLAGFYLVLFAFVLPSSLTTITSIIFFSVSFHQIRMAPHMSSNRDRRDVVICIKLCVIVGLAWPLQVLDGILDMSMLSFVAVALNGLQGVFIFAAYICNARILELYKRLLCGKHSLTSSDPAHPGVSNSSCSTKGTVV